MLSLRILLVEDSFEHQQIFSDILKENRPQVRVDVAYTGEEFVQLARDPSIDCFLVDFNLPDGSASELLERVSQSVGDRPVIIMSASDDQKVAIEAFRHGGWDFVPKDQAVEGDVLWQRVEAAIKRWRQRRDGIRKAQQAVKDLLRQSETDALTGLYNRHYFMRMLSHNSPLRGHTQSLGCIMLDLDHFKQLNDTFGHAVGDRVLKSVAKIINQQAGPGEMAFRWGGEEFVIFRPAEELSDVMLWAESLRKSISEATMARTGRTISFTASLGVVHRTAPRLGLDIIDLADQALYLAKKQGGDRVCTWDMVCVERRLTECDMMTQESPTARRAQFLKSCARTLGRHQMEHLTDHCEQVAHIAAELATILHMSPEQIHQVRAAGLFHDIGKSVVPEGLIGKSDPLTEPETQILSRHVEESGRIALRLGLDPASLQLVGLHHERFDAHHNGDLPLGARVLSAADAMAAMLSERAYRPACTTEQMKREMQRYAGSQFDPIVVDAATNHADHLCAA
ncbi:MAG: diguanylate cyclase [Tepidisphaeraceae bacterium]|jgi:diguanylate cyclase (GGDEF)-like protein/putative nucleotidyltransferase with HDIG domain